MRYLSMMVIVFLVAGCATQSQRQMNAAQQNITVSMSAFKACIQQIEGTPAYNIVNSKSLITAPKPTLAQMTDDTKINAKEKEAIFKVREHTDRCKQDLLSALSGVATAYAPSFLDIWAKSDKMTVELVKKKITWGDYNVSKAEAIAEFARQNQIITAEINRGLSQQHQQEMASRQHFFDQMQQWSYQQQVLNALNRPSVSTTNCNSFGNNTNCTTIGR